MISFMIGVLGSVTFWIFYAILSLFMVVITMKKMKLAERQYIILTENIDIEYDLPLDSFDYMFATLTLLLHMLIWPAIIIVSILYILVFKMCLTVFTKVIGEVLKKLEKSIPNVTIHKN